MTDLKLNLKILISTDRPNKDFWLWVYQAKKHQKRLGALLNQHTIEIGNELRSW